MGAAGDETEGESEATRERRHFFAHEVVQTSGMDCGPAALKSLLEGFGIRAHYGRLREACHTSVDGSSIDTLEELARTLGLDAAQMMVPVEHVLLRDADALPALVVVRLPSGLTHFVVVWRVIGPWVQIMDPGRGRRWMRKRDLLRDLYVHEMQAPAADVRAWTREPGFLDPLRRRLHALGVSDVDARLAAAATGDDWHLLCALDACARATERLCSGRVVSRGKAARTFDRLLADATNRGGGGLVPDTLWTARPAGEPDDSPVIMRGALALRVAGVAEPKPSEPLSPDLAAVLADDQPGPARKLVEFLRADGLLRFVPIAAALALAGVGTVVESLLFRSAIDIGQRLALFEQRLAAAGALVVLLAALFFVEWPLARALWAAGSRLEMRLREAFLRKLPLLGDRYFQSRPISDMAERAHLLHWLRLLPGQGGQLLRTTCEMITTTAGVIWLYPSGAPLMLTMVGLMLALPLVCQPALVERDMRMRGHAGGLARFYLDALLGLSAIRAHTAEPALRAEHGGRLREWARAARDATRLAVMIETAQGLLGFGLAAIVVFRYLTSTSGSGWAILIVYWVFILPSLGQEIAFLIQQYPQHRNVTLRLLEPLSVPENTDDADGAPAPISGAAGVTVDLCDVRVKAAGNEILAVDSLTIAAGEHVAIVGSSGAGKSSLIGLLLGWYRPDVGVVRADGQDLRGRWLDELRRQTLWVDPTVQLWNRSLLDNLRFGSDGEHGAVGAAVEAAELDEVLARLPMGLQTPLGAGGALLSGGEGQRVRLGRAICRGAARLVIFDEPFCGLERVRREKLLVAARARWAAATFLCITHDIRQTLDFSRVLVVANGRVVEDGDPSRLAGQADTHYFRLLAAEDRARARLNGPEWRHLRLEKGQIVERSPSPSAGEPT